MNLTYFGFSLFAFILFLFLFYSLNLKAANTFFPAISFLLVVTLLRGTLSLFLIESGSYIPEQIISGFINGSLIYYLLFMSVTLIVLYWCTRKTKLLSFEPKERDAIDLVFFILAFFKLIVVLEVVYSHPQLNKFDFYSSTFNPRLLLAIDLIFESLLWVQMIRRTSYFWLWAGLSFLIAASKKSYLGAIVGPLEMSIFSLMLRGHLSYKTLIKVSTPLVAVGLALKLYTLHGVPMRLFDRFVMDNHMFWGAVNLANKNIHGEWSGFWADFWNTQLYQANSEYGLGELMKYLSPSLSDGFLSSKIRFTNGYPAILIFKLGVPGALLAHVFFTGLLFKIWIFFIKNSMNFNIIELIIFYKLFAYYIDFMSMGEYGYFRAKFIFIALVGLMTFILFRFYRNRLKRSTDGEHSHD